MMKNYLEYFNLEYRNKYGVILLLFQKLIQIKQKGIYNDDCLVGLPF